MAIAIADKHSVFIHDRGGLVRIDEILKAKVVRWNRMRDDISEATVHITAANCAGQKSVLEAIEPGRHELVIYRGADRVWEGPIDRLTDDGTTFSIHAKDVLFYANRTAMHAAYSNAHPNKTTVIKRIAGIMRAELARKEAIGYNILSHLVTHEYPDDAGTAAVTKKMQYTVFEHLDNLAARSGLDYTVVGRAIHLWDTHRKIGQTAVVSQSDFLGDVTVSVYGSELATRAIVTDGEGNYGMAGVAVDPYYGEWEILATAYDETDEGPAPTNAEMASQAQRNMAGRNPTPLQLRIPDNSRLNPAGVLTMDDLVPGVYVPLRTETNVRTITQMQKLQSVTVEETEKGESIQITLYPAAGEDGDPA